MTTPTQDATARPWKVRDIGTHNVWIEARDLGSRFVCDMEADESDNAKERAQIHANAAFIVLACNAHDELVAAVEAVLYRHTGGTINLGIELSNRLIKATGATP